MKTISGINSLMIALTLGVLSARPARADDNRKNTKDCQQNGVEQEHTWMWEGSVGFEKIVTVIGSVTQSMTGRARCEQTAPQLGSDAGTYRSKPFQQSGEDACAIAPIRKPPNAPNCVQDVLWPCGLGAAESAPKPQE